MTPINHILCLTTSLLESDLNEKQREGVNAIWQSGERMRYMTESQLINYRIDCKQYKLKSSLATINSIEKQIKLLFSAFEDRLKQRKQIIAQEFFCESNDTDLEYWTDWKIYICIVYHLVSNAIKHGISGQQIKF